MSGGPFHRSPAVFTEIGAITPEDAGRSIRVMGFIVDLQNKSGFIISDDTGRITVLAENSPPLQSFIRVFGSIALSPEGQRIIRAELVQGLAKLDKHLFKRAIKLVQATASGRKI